MNVKDFKYNLELYGKNRIDDLPIIVEYVVDGFIKHKEVSALQVKKLGEKEYLFLGIGES